jgi:hypothetical protein
MMSFDRNYKDSRILAPAARSPSGLKETIAYFKRSLDLT